MEILVRSILNYYKQQPFFLKPRESYHQLLHTLFFSDLTLLRFFIFQASLFTSVFLFLPGDTTDRPIYHLIRLFFSEINWALLFLLHATASFISQFILRRACIFGFLFEGVLGCVLWNTLTICLMFAVYPPPIFSGAFCISISSWLILARYEPFFDQKKTAVFNRKGLWNPLNWYK